VFEIGNSLREARRRRGLELGEVEQAIKIRTKYLRALEDEAFELLPSQTYVKGFLRSYADFLGLEGQLFVDEYNSRFFVDEDAPRRRVRRSRDRPPPRAHLRVERNVALLTLVAVAAVTALVIAAWRFGGGEEQSIPNLAQGPPPAAAVEPEKPRVRRADLFVQAVRGSSLLQVRVGSARGRHLFQGTLERGQSERFVARRLWINVGAPENLWLRLNGRPIRIGGDCPRVLVITATSLRSNAHCG
jgi:hypothetical protein